MNEYEKEVRDILLRLYDLLVENNRSVEMREVAAKSLHAIRNTFAEEVGKRILNEGVK